MSDQNALQYWEAWYPKAAATGLLVGRCQIDPVDSILLHSPPEILTVAVYDASGARLASGADLPRTAETPMARLTRQGNTINRLDIWPTDQDLQSIVLLPGGEAGILKAWWHAPDHSEWRWQVEFYNAIHPQP